MLHRNVPPSGRHPAHAFEYANAAARTGATGLTAEDVDKLALQTDTNYLYILVNHSPVMWVSVTGDAGSPDWTHVQNKPATFPPDVHGHDHGSMTGLADDDHPQYALTNPNAVAVAYNAAGTTTIALNGRDEAFHTTAATGVTTWAITGAATSGKTSAFALELTNGGSQTQTWPASVKWDGGVAPTLTAAGLDILTFYTRDAGTTWRGGFRGGARERRRKRRDSRDDLRRGRRVGRTARGGLARASRGRRSR